MTNSGNAPNQPRRIRAIIRRRMALQLRLAGRSEEEIRYDIYKAEINQAQAMGEDASKVKLIAQQTVSKLITRARIDLEAETELTAAEYKKLQRADINTALMVMRQGLGSKDVGERYAAADRLLRQWERFSRLQGLDAPERKDFTSGGEAIRLLVEYTDKPKTNEPEMKPDA